MKIKLRLSKSGNGYYLYLPKVIKETLEVSEGDKILVDIIEVVKDEIARYYNCKECQNHFHSTDLLPYCNICESQNLEEIE